MTLNHLTVFIAVAESCSMSEAARRLYRSQPAVSQTIRELEEHYQVQLFDRLGRKLYITPSGTELLKYARQVTENFDLLERTMAGTPHALSIRIGASVTVGTCMLPSVVRNLKNSMEGLRIRSVVTNTAQIEQMLLNSELDVAIVEGTVYAPELLVTPVVDDYLVLACGKNHPFYTRDRIAPADLQGMEFAFREKGSGTRLLFEQYLKRHGIEVEACLEANSPGAILNAVVENNALAVMSVRLMQEEAKRGNVRIFRMETGEWNRSFRLVFHRDKLVGSEIRALEQVLETCALPTIPDFAAGTLTAENG